MRPHSCSLSAHAERYPTTREQRGYVLGLFNSDEAVEYLTGECGWSQEEAFALADHVEQAIKVALAKRGK